MVAVEAATWQQNKSLKIWQWSIRRVRKPEGGHAELCEYLVRENQDWHARFGEKVGAEVKR